MLLSKKRHNNIIKKVHGKVNSREGEENYTKEMTVTDFSLYNIPFSCCLFRHSVEFDSLNTTTPTPPEERQTQTLYYYDETARSTTRRSTLLTTTSTDTRRQKFRFCLSAVAYI